MKRVLQDYADHRVRFTYPAEYKLKATESSGQYYLRRSKSGILSVSVLPKGMAASAFNSMASAPVPGTDRRRAVHQHYALGGKQGRAIEWEILNAGERVAMKDLIFLFESGEWDILAELHTRPPTEAHELVEIIASLQVTSQE
jgi:hypothetical protein